MKIYLCFRSFRKEMLDDVMKQIMAMGLKISGPISLPIQRKRFTVNCSPHIYKKSREQFEIATHSRLMIISEENANTRVFLTLLENIICGGVELKIKLVTQ